MAQLKKSFVFRLLDRLQSALFRMQTIKHLLANVLEINLVNKIFKSLILLYYFILCDEYLHLSISCMPSANISQSDFLRLQSQIVVSYTVDPRN